MQRPNPSPDSQFNWNTPVHQIGKSIITPPSGSVPLPPVIQPCVEPSNTFVTTDSEPSHSFSGGNPEPSAMFDPCEALSLMLGTTSMIIPLSWILYNSVITPLYYNLYRKKSTDIYYKLIATFIYANTYSDSSTLVSTTYQYYVRPVFSTGVEGIQSNVVQATTPPLQYVYSLTPSFLDVYDVSIPTSIVRAAHIASGDGGGSANGEYSDSQFMWIQNGNNLYTYDIHTNPLSPIKVATLANTRNFIIRRGLTNRNNILIRNKSTDYSVETYNITDPASPTLISSKANVFGAPTFHGLVYDSIGNQLLNIHGDGFSAAYLYGLPIASDGTLGTWNQIFNINDSLGRNWRGCAFLHNGMYWSESFTGNIAALKLDGSGYGVGGGPVPGIGTESWGSSFARIKGNYLFLGNGTSSANEQAFWIVNVSTWTTITQLGGIGNICDGFAVSGNLLVVSIGGILSVYDITSTLVNGGLPVLDGSLSESNLAVGITGQPTDGWEGNSGGCAS